MIQSIHKEQCLFNPEVPNSFCAAALCKNVMDTYLPCPHILFLVLQPPHPKNLPLLGFSSFLSNV